MSRHCTKIYWTKAKEYTGVFGVFLYIRKPLICRSGTMKGTLNHRHRRSYPKKITVGSSREAGRLNIIADLDKTSCDV